jgi:hypothetical protein
MVISFESFVVKRHFEMHPHPFRQNFKIHRIIST